MLSIKETEQLTGITSQNIRYYERQGLLHPVRNPGNDYRQYSQEDIRSLKTIKLLRKLDMPIDEIRKVLNHNITFEDALCMQKERLREEENRLQGVLEFCDKITVSDLEQLDPDVYLDAMTEAEKKGVVFVNLLEDYRKVAIAEELRVFSFMPDTMCMNPQEFTEALCKYANENQLNLVITKESMYPEFTIDGIAYEADREFSRFGAVIYCRMKYPEQVTPAEIPAKRYRFLQAFHKLIPLFVVAFFLFLTNIDYFTKQPLVGLVMVLGGVVSVVAMYRFFINFKSS